MSSKRTLLSRPRTRIYDANYNIGENYYRPALDRLDRKYTGRPLDAAPRATSVPQGILDAHQKAFFDDDLPSARKRAEKAIGQPSLFDSRGGRISAAMDLLAEQDIDEETASALKRIRANKKVSILDDVDLDSTVSNITARRIKKRADGLLDTVGISTIESGRSASVLDDSTSDAIVRRRAVLKITTNESQDSNSGNELTKWSALNRAQENSSLEESSASIRARQSRARIAELEDEMNDMAEKQAARERRAARLRALVAETAADSEREASSSTAIKSIKISQRRQRQAIEM